MIFPELTAERYRGLNILKSTIALFVFFIPLIYGSVHYFVLITEYSIALILILSYIYLRQELTLSKPFIIFLLFLFFTLIVTLLQLIPLPLSFIKFISSKEFEILSQINKIYNNLIEPIKFYTLSIEPYANIEYFVRIIILSLIFIVASQYEFSETYILLKSIAYCGTVIVLYGFVEGLLNFRTFYSQPISITNEGIIPSVFINTNHQAGFLGLSLFSGVSLFYSVREKNERVIFLLCSILSGLGIFLTLSRGGIIAFISSLLFFGFLLIKERLSARKSMFLLASALIIITLAFYLAYKEISEELLTLTDMRRLENEKYRLVLSSIGLFKDFLLVGIGKGGFESIYNMYREDTLHVSFPLMENQIFQQLADYGIFHFTIMLLVLGYFAYTFLKYTISIRTALLITGLFYILLQNLVDFNLEIFSVQVAVVVIIATLISRLYHLKDKSEVPVYKTFTISLGKGRFFVISTILVVIFIQSTYLATKHRREKVEAEIELMLNKGLPPDDNFFIEKIKLYPFNYYIPASIAARNFLDTERPIVKSYLLHSTLINPVAFEPHYMLYRFFLKKGERAHAQSESRLAIKYAYGNRERLIFSELLTNIDKDELFKYIPYIPEKITSFAEYLINNSEMELAKEFVEDALYLSNENLEVMRTAFNIYIKLKDIKNAHKVLTKLEKLDSGFTKYYLRGIFYEVQDRNEEALEHFIKADTINPLNADTLMRIANLYNKINKLQEARRYYLKVFLCDNINNETKVSIYTNLANTYLKEKNIYEALKYLRTALNLKNNDIGVRLSIASICEANGNLNCALNEYREILRINPQISNIESRIREIEKSLKELEDAKRIEKLK
ncbi:MAG: O-antigen ligase family protein [Deltaproteobacteria bacterium]|nr:O-antigen ligase family protein [Deltaproteobacteria bacterium]